MEAHKSFLTLARLRENYRAAGDDTAARAWVVAGAVDEVSEREDDAEAQLVRIHVRSWSFLTMVQQRHLRDGYDYLDFGVKPWLPGVPKSFKGPVGPIRMEETTGKPPFRSAVQRAGGSGRGPLGSLEPDGWR